MIHSNHQVLPIGKSYWFIFPGFASDYAAPDSLFIIRLILESHPKRTQVQMEVPTASPLFLFLRE
jgi:hypothetical protein